MRQDSVSMEFRATRSTAFRWFAILISPICPLPGLGGDSTRGEAESTLAFVLCGDSEGQTFVSRQDSGTKRYESEDADSAG